MTIVKSIMLNNELSSEVAAKFGYTGESRVLFFG